MRRLMIEFRPDNTGPSTSTASTNSSLALSFIALRVLSETRVKNLRDEAREKGQEISKLNCINDKLSLIKGHVNLSEKSYIAMDEGEQKNDVNSISHHYILIALSAGKVSNLEDEALLCVGKSLNLDDSGASGAIEADDIVKVDPVLPGGYTQLEDIFGDIYDTTGLTPIR